MTVAAINEIRVIDRTQWEQQWQAVQPRISELAASANTTSTTGTAAAARNTAPNIMRVSQLDADQLDFEILSIMTMQFNKIFEFFNINSAMTQPTVTAVVRLLIWYYSVWSDGTTYGKKVQNLTYRNEFLHDYYDASSDAELSGLHYRCNSQSRHLMHIRKQRAE
jgi:hypothetical protein